MTLSHREKVVSRLFEQLQKAAEIKARARVASEIAADEVIAAAARAAAETVQASPEPEPEPEPELKFEHAPMSAAPPARERTVPAAVKALALALILALAAVGWYYEPWETAPSSAKPKQAPASKLDRELRTSK